MLPLMNHRAVYYSEYDKIDCENEEDDKISLISCCDGEVVGVFLYYSTSSSLHSSHSRTVYPSIFLSQSIAVHTLSTYRCLARCNAEPSSHSFFHYVLFLRFNGIFLCSCRMRDSSVEERLRVFALPGFYLLVDSESTFLLSKVLVDNCHHSSSSSFLIAIAYFSLRNYRHTLCYFFQCDAKL